MTFPFPLFFGGTTNKLATFTDSFTDSAGTSSTHNFGTRTIGAEFTNRIIVAVVSGTTGTGGRSFTDLTCNGVSGTRVLNVPSGSGGEQTCAFFVFTGVSGTTAAFVGTSTANVGNGDIALFSLFGVKNATPTNTNNQAGNFTDYSVDLILPENGVIVAAAVRNTMPDDPSVTWSGVTEVVRQGDSRFACESNVPPPSRTVGIHFPSTVSNGSKLLACAWI